LRNRALSFSIGMRGSRWCQLETARDDDLSLRLQWLQKARDFGSERLSKLVDARRRLQLTNMIRDRLFYVACQLHHCVNSLHTETCQPSN